MMWTAFLFLSTIVIFLFPLLPGFIELRLASDARPLRVIQEYDTDITYFAHGFRQYLKRNFVNFFTDQDTTANAVYEQGFLRDHTNFLIMNHSNKPQFDVIETKRAHTSRLILGQQSMELPGNMFFEKEIYSANSLTTGDHSEFRAILAEGDVTLSHNTTIFRWLHSGGVLTIGEGCALYGRVSAEASIFITGYSQFERIHAPVIQFGTTEAIAETATELTILEELPNVIDHFKKRWLVSGDSIIPAHHAFEGNLIARGNITIGEGSVITGSLKSNKTLTLNKQVRVTGSVVSTGDIYIEEGSHITGPIIAEGTLFIAPGCVIGEENAPTTVTGQRIVIKHGVTVYGTVWADKYAELLAEEAA